MTLDQSRRDSVEWKEKTQEVTREGENNDNKVVQPCDG